MDKDISRVNLIRHEIYYQPDVYHANPENIQPTIHALPDHIDAVRDGLLSMEKILPEDCDATLREEVTNRGSVDIGPDWCLHPQRSAFIRGKHHERVLQQSASHDNLRFCEQVAERAQEILEDSEDEWTFFWRSEIFRLFSDEAREQSGFIPTLDTWSLYENVRWNEFDNFTRHRLLIPDRTQPQPDLTYAFPIQTSPPDSLKGFARDEFTQALSLQSLGKLAEQGIVCAPTTALRKWTTLPDKTRWSSSDRSCFPWAVVEMKKHTSASNDDDVERCYCQAANAAAAALDLQAQLFDKLKDGCSLQPPPVVVFTCIGPVVKVWLAYQDESRIFRNPMQRMVCIWSTSVQLTWGVASMRAIIRNMHTWSSRLLKPKLQAAIVRASESLRISGQINPQHSLCQSLPIPTSNRPSVNTTNSSPTPSRQFSRATPVIAQAFDKPITPARQITRAQTSGHLQTNTSTQPSSPEDISPRCNNQVKETFNTQNNTCLSPNNGVFGGCSTTRTPGLFGRATGVLFGQPNSRANNNTTTGPNTRKSMPTGGLFRGSIDLTQRFGQHPKEVSADIGTTGGALPGPSTPAYQFPGTNGNNISNLCFGSSKPAFDGYGSNETTSILGSSKPAFGVFGTHSKSVEGGLVGSSKLPDNIALSRSGEKSPLPVVTDVDVSDLAAVFQSSRLEDVFRDNGPVLGTAGVPFSAHSEWNGTQTLQQYQTITCQSPYVSYSLEELRMADYNGGRRYGRPSAEFGRSTDSSKTGSEHTDGGLFGAMESGSESGSDFELDSDPEDTVSEPRDDSDYDNSSDTSSGRNTFGGRIRAPISGDRLIDLPAVKRMISGLKRCQQRRIIRMSEAFLNPDGTCSVPLNVVVGSINLFLEPEDRLF